jgi:catechol 2,3-dioxygenase-like lactoylglutathione lyase family enzyme
MIQTALRVTGIDHVVLHVRDLPRERRFYTEVLGMTVAHENERQCFLHCGNGQQVALFLTRDGGDIHAGSEMNHMALRLESGEYDEVKGPARSRRLHDHWPQRRPELHLLQRS